ncbi:MAG: hypothetical protein JNK45_34085 [Myxococcales bacterium]|nr:hypothetical protein [Myxococcales bacterium]
MPTLLQPCGAVPSATRRVGRGLVVMIAVAVVPQVVAAGVRAPTWSDDGTAEAAALRARASARGHDELAATVGTRGVTYEKNVFADTPPPGPATRTVGPGLPPDDGPSIDVDDIRRTAELERIAKRGRSFFIPGIVLSTLGTIFVIGGIAGMAKDANGVTVGLTLGSATLAAIGYPLMFVGVKMRRHPEKYLGRRVQARIAPTGLSLRF